MKLIQFVTIHGQEVWINPKHVSAVYENTEDETSIYLLGVADPYVLRGTLHNILHKLI